MLLRRMMQHVREQNWTAVGIDFAIVVIGVFVGIQVSNWNEARQQSARQASYMQRLQVDFVGIRDRLQEHFTVYREAIEGGDYLLSLVATEISPGKDIAVDKTRLGRAFTALVSTRIPPPLPATYVEMRSEGQLSYIGNRALRDRLAEYDRLLGVVQEVARLAGDMVTAQAPIVQRHFVSRAVGDDSALSGIRNDLLSYDIAGMRGDREFAVAVMVLQRYALNSLQQRKIQLALIDSILTLIDAEKTP